MLSSSPEQHLASIDLLATCVFLAPCITPRDQSEILSAAAHTMNHFGTLKYDDIDLPTIRSVLRNPSDLLERLNKLLLLHKSLESVHIM